jgi:hypothetical protein
MSPLGPMRATFALPDFMCALPNPLLSVVAHVHLPCCTICHFFNKFWNSQSDPRVFGFNRSIAKQREINLPILGGVRLWYEPHLQRIREDAKVRRADIV